MTLRSEDDGLIEIVVIADRSGSTASVLSDFIGGFNTFLQEQKKNIPDARYTFTQFDDIYDVVHDGIVLKDAPLLTKNTFVPRGCTALYDAIGNTVDNVGKRLDTTPVEKRPSKVMVVILTDGLENASRKYTSKEIQDKITHQRDVYSWEFVFLGANQDAIATGERLGIHGNYCASTISTPDGNQAIGRTISAAVRHYVGGQSVNTVNLSRIYKKVKAQITKQ